MIRKLGLRLNWEPTIGGTKAGLFTLCEVVQAIADKQDEAGFWFNAALVYAKSAGQTSPGNHKETSHDPM